MSQFWIYFELGLSHVLDWNGYDHILFLIVLAAPFTFRDWKKALILVTLFTLGHTAALVLSIYEIIAVNASLVEFLIPATILATAVYNIITGGKTAANSKILWISTIFFGIIHGLGFSNYFRLIESGSSSKMLQLVSFALGIELAQVLIVISVIMLTFLMTSVIRFSEKEWVLIASSVVIGLCLPILRDTAFW
ncbi:HupE/UreJ family protein [Gangjinia marincola]|uniref:HupE/UreJ family protein n=1 Tax=Gangjinia marincola TaxID=578463 RepID=A0ABN1MI72_9FLAO